MSATLSVPEFAIAARMAASVPIAVIAEDGLGKCVLGRCVLVDSGTVPP